MHLPHATVIALEWRRPPFNYCFRKWNVPFPANRTGIPFSFQWDRMEQKRHRFFDRYCTCIAHARLYMHTHVHAHTHVTVSDNTRHMHLKFLSSGRKMAFQKISRVGQTSPLMQPWYMYIHMYTCTGQWLTPRAYRLLKEKRACRYLAKFIM